MSDQSPSNSAYTTKDMLLRIDAKLDALAGRMTTLELKQAVTEALVSETRKDAVAAAKIAEGAAGEISSIKQTMRYAAGALGIVIFLAPFVFAVLTRG